MNALIPETWSNQATTVQPASERASASPRPQHGRLISNLLGLLPVLLAVGGGLWAALGRHA